MDYAMGDGSYYSENIFDGILCALISSFPFKATMLLLKLNLIHTICLKDNIHILCCFEHLDGSSQFHFHPLAVWTHIVRTMHKNILIASNEYNRKNQVPKLIIIILLVIKFKDHDDM